MLILPWRRRKIGNQSPSTTPCSSRAACRGYQQWGVSGGWSGATQWASLRRARRHMDGSRLLKLQQLPAGSQWAWAATRPTEAELRTCGFPASEWASPVEPQAASPAEPQARNMLLLLHGLGDQPAGFASLGRKMALPETTVLALRAPLPLPAGLPGHAWHESFTEDGGPLDTQAPC